MMFKITPAIREYFNYRYDDASFRLEEARLEEAKLNGLRDPRQRDFRTRKQRQEDGDPAQDYDARAVSETGRSTGVGARSVAGGSVK